MTFKQKIYKFLRWLEQFTGTDMIYLTHGAFWLTLEKVIEVLIGLGLMILFGRLVTKEVFGAYQYVLSITGLLSIFSLPGLDTALIRTVAKGNEKMLAVCFKEKNKWSLLGSFVLLLIAGWYFWHQNSFLGTCFIIVALFLPFINSFLLFSGFWQGKKRFDLQNKYLIMFNLLANLALILFIIFTKKLTLIIFGYCLGFTLAGAIFYFLTVKKVADGEKEKETISFGKHLTLMSAVSTVAAYFDKIVLWHFLGPLAVATYYFAERPTAKMRELFPISTLALPKLSQRNIKEIKKGLWQKFLKLFLVAGSVIIVYVVLCPYFYKWLFPAYLNSVFYSQVLALCLIFMPFNLLGAALTAEMRKKELYVLSFVTPASKIILFLILIPFWGIWGIIFSIQASYLINSLLTLYFFRKI